MNTDVTNDVTKSTHSAASLVLAMHALGLYFVQLVTHVIMFGICEMVVMETPGNGRRKC